MPINGTSSQDTALENSSIFLTNLIKIVQACPRSVPGIQNLSERLNNIRDALDGLRPPRIAIVGRCKAGKSSLINAIIGAYVADTHDFLPMTGEAKWIDYRNSTDQLVEILDTRGLQEAEQPLQKDSASDPLSSILYAVKAKCPDVLLFLCEASQVHVAIDADLDVCEEIVSAVKKYHSCNISLIGVLTKCDLLSPPQLSVTHERKQRSIQEQKTRLFSRLQQRETLRQYLKQVVPVACYAEYERVPFGLIMPNEDFRWNIDELIDVMMRYTPREARGGIARMAGIKEFQLTCARTMQAACVAVSAALAAVPIPFLDIAPVAVIQSFMVMYIGWIAGRSFSSDTLQEVAQVASTAVGADLAIRVAVRFIPGIGSVISATATAAATQGIGDVAIRIFLQQNIEESNNG